MGLFRKAEDKFVGGKFLLYGETGSGKSTFILSFPKVGVIDTEAGMANYEGHDNLLFVANTTSHKDVKEAMIEIEDEYMDKIQTFAVDSETKIYDSMQITSMELEEQRAREKKGNADDANVSIRGWGKIKNLTKQLQSMKIDLSTRGIFVVSTAQKGDITKMIDNERVKIGERVESHKSIPYDYDVILRLYLNRKGKKITYMAEIEKDRTHTFEIGERVENPSFEMWKPYYDAKKKLGKIESSNYKTDIARDEKRQKEEDNFVEKALVEIKDFYKSVVKSSDKASANKMLKEIFTHAKMKKLSWAGVDTEEKAKLCLEKIKEIQSKESDVESKDIESEEVE